MRCRKVRRILLYHVPDKLLSPEKFAHHVMLLFFSIQSWKTFVVSHYIKINCKSKEFRMLQTGTK